MDTRTLKIDQKEYIWDFLEAKGMTLYYATVLSFRARLFISMDQAGNDNSINFAIYQ